VVKFVISCGFYALYWMGIALQRLCGKRDLGTCVVLTYHDIASEERVRFARQMDTLLRYVRPVRADFGIPLPNGERCAAVTFDDGLVNFAEHVLPELEKRSIPATLFIVAGKLGEQADWAHDSYALNAVMTSTQLREIADKVLIGSHTVTHPVLTLLGRTDAKRELKESRLTLERMLGRNVTLFSFPYGNYNEDLLEWCSEAGYRRVFTMLPQIARSNTTKFVVGRVRADPTDWPLEFRLKLLGAYQWLPVVFAAKRWILVRLNGANGRTWCV